MEGNTMIGITNTKTLSKTIVRCLLCIFDKAEMDISFDGMELTSLPDMIENIQNHGDMWG